MAVHHTHTVRFQKQQRKKVKKELEDRKDYCTHCKNGYPPHTHSEILKTTKKGEEEGRREGREGKE